MRRITFYLLVALALSIAAAAQSNPSVSVGQPANGPANVAGVLYAANFAHWSVPPGSAGGFSWTSPNQCFVASGGATFPAFNTNAPITIVDTGTPANTETVTPTTALYGSWGCSVGLPATHSHKTYYLTSGTAGLQEALNYAGGSDAVVILTADWSALGGTTAMITSSAAGANTSVLDMRTSALVAYSGTTPSAQSTGTGKTVLQTSPTLITPILGVATATSVNGALFQSAAGVPSANCAIGTIGENLSASSASTVLYVCYPANTWTAITVP